jgi:hypothetical protein
MPIVEPKIAKTLQAAIMSELASAFGGPNAPPDAANSHKQLAEAISKAVAKVIANLLLTEVQVAPGIPTAGSPAAQVTTAPGKLL